ncbi:DUF4190 domain-containing protein [Spirosoma montaniterrae]|uniref:DUF4190 domain-containing protein n=1 Tax=Spirosoma montaniterrae TaxID=1178516 RepID=A0A1P9WRX4_9BACT|nr:DUF4190 domain-containing protein [Spirosoma montaniterrae]AQG78125.1 hypothetical protein AWR27_01410 [Spirosoma montaniterrae]
MYTLYRSASAWSFVYLLFLVSLAGCSRAPQAYFQPTARTVYERPASATPQRVETAPTPDLTASLAEVPPTAPRSVYDVETALPAAKPAIPTTVRRPNALSSLKRMMPRKPAAPGCDQIVLRNGDVIDAKVKEVGVNEIRYKKCDRQDGPDYTISKRDVLSIKYSNGEVERFNSSPTQSSSSSSGGRNQSYNSPTNPQNDGPRTDPFAIVALAAGGLAIFTSLGAFLLGAAAIVFGALSLQRIKRQPERFKGRGMAIGGMVAGIVAAGIILLALLGVI